MTCGYKLGAGTTCGGTLTFSTDRIGRVRERCARCDRRKAGLCADCPRRVVGTVGKALRCAGCKKRALARNTRRWKERDCEHWCEVKRAVDRRLRDRRRGGPPMPKEEQYRNLGLARAAALTPERRSEIARKATKTRWERAKAAA